jgi:hypothetical protein
MSIQLKIKELEKRVDVVWSHGIILGESGNVLPWRYVPLGFGDGTTRWGVYDMRNGHYVHNTRLIKMDLGDLQEVLGPNEADAKINELLRSRGAIYEITK